ncbi:hypothetical protein ACX0G7_21275 [Flavitalea antarctica]
MNINRRHFVASMTGGMLALKARSQSNQFFLKPEEIVSELKDGEGWLRLVQKDKNKFEIHGGYKEQTTVLYREPLGVRWYRNNGNNPDGERRVAWTKADKVEKGDILWTLYATIDDTQSGTWEAISHVKKDAGGYRLTTEITRRGPARSASVRVHTFFTAPPAQAFTLIPGVVYNGNKADAIVPRGYCPMITDYEVKTREAGSNRRVIADLPRQDASTWYTVHLWGYQAASASVSVFEPNKKAGTHLGYARKEKSRVLGVIHTADPVTNFHEVTIENPCVRERRFRNCTWVSSPDRPYEFKDGESAVVELRLMPVGAPDIPSFVSTWTGERSLRRKGLAPGQDGKVVSTADLVPRSYASELAINWNNTSLWEENKGYYRTVHHTENHPRELILGWGSGTMMMLPMFINGDAEIKNRIRTMTRFYIEHAQAPGGLFYGVRMKDGKWITADGNLDFFWAMNSLTPRRTTDTVFYGLSLADTLRNENGTGDKALADQLDRSLEKACEALARVWKKEGNIPFLLNPHTEKTVWSGAFGGARAISCLALGSKRFNRPDFLQTAKDIAFKYVADGLMKGETWGGPTDTLQGTADNESMTAMAEGLTLLYSITKQQQFLKWASQMSDLLATWVLDERIDFPADSVLGKNGIQPFGAMIANTQNAWGTPGMCVNSGRFLLDLYEFTGERRFMDLLSDIVRVPLQMMVRPGIKWGNLEPGQMTECASFNDVPDEFGHAYLNSATWPVNSMLLGNIELPSIYIDGEHIWRLDHLQAELNDKGNLVIINPTEYPANALLRWRNGKTKSVALPPKESRLIS